MESFCAERPDAGVMRPYVGLGIERDHVPQIVMTAHSIKEVLDRKQIPYSIIDKGNLPSFRVILSAPLAPREYVKAFIDLSQAGPSKDPQNFKVQVTGDDVTLTYTVKTNKTISVLISEKK